MPKIVCVVKTCGPVPGKDKLKLCELDIGEDELLTVVTNAPNVREGSRLIVATLGTEVDMEGQTVEVKRTNVGGVYSNGMLMDSVMLGWAGGAAGIAAQVPDSFNPGDTAPFSKPRMDGGSGYKEVTPVEPEVSAKELKAREKAARKAILAEKKEKRKADKTVAGDGKEEKDVEASGSNNNINDEDEEAHEEW